MENPIKIALPDGSWLVGILGGGIGWIGGIMLIFGAYDLFGGGGFLLTGLGFSLVCFGEGFKLLKKREVEEIALLRKNILKELIKNMVFPTIWLLIFFVSSFELFLALGFATGVKAMVRNLGIIISFYTSS